MRAAGLENTSFANLELSITRCSLPTVGTLAPEDHSLYASYRFTTLNYLIYSTSYTIAGYIFADLSLVATVATNEFFTLESQA